MSALERNPQILATTQHKDLGPGINGRGILEAPEQLAWGLAFPEATRACPGGPRPRGKHLPQLEKIQEVLPFRRDEAHFR